MDANYEAFMLYYTAFHANEITTKEFREMLIGDIGEDGFAASIDTFRQERLKREAAGDRRTLHETTIVVKSE